MVARTLKTEGFVLKKKSLPTQDILLTFFSEEAGKIVLIAKGVKKITSKRLPTIQTGNLLEIVAYKKADYYYLQESKLTSSFLSIKKQNDKVSALYFILFVVDRLLPQDQKEEPIYIQTKQYIFNLAKAGKLDMNTLEEFLNTLLMALGYLNEPRPLSQLKVLIESITEEKLPFYIM